MQETKRNRRPQKVHLEIARATQEIMMRVSGENWRNGNGRPAGSPNKEHPKAEDILRWRPSGFDQQDAVRP